MTPKWNFKLIKKIDLLFKWWFQIPSHLKKEKKSKTGPTIQQIPAESNILMLKNEIKKYYKCFRIYFHIKEGLSKQSTKNKKEKINKIHYAII